MFWGLSQNPQCPEWFSHHSIRCPRQATRENGGSYTTSHIPHRDRKHLGINANIPPENSKVQYRSLEEVIECGLRYGPSTWAARMDIESAFRNLPIHPDDLYALGFSLRGQFYINSSLPFGAASSCNIFEKVASAVGWMVQDANTDEGWLSHYLGNFPLLAPSETELQAFMSTFSDICNDIGLPVAPDKTLAQIK